MKSRTMHFPQRAYIRGRYSLVGKLEGEGPLNKWFDKCLNNDLWQEKSYEMAERKMLENAVEGALRAGNLGQWEAELAFGGDLLNQIISAAYTFRDLGIPFMGIYGACSNMSLSLMLGGALVGAGYFNNVVCATSSHFCTAERQYRYPLEMGVQRTPNAQWTVTGAGATLLSQKESGLFIDCATVGKIWDMGVSDLNNMGAAMAPAAADTIRTHLQNTNTTPADYDAIVTGDLGKLGSRILCEKLLADLKGFPQVHRDCGCMIYAPEQDPHMGGSGCGCSASVFNGYFLTRMERGELNSVLLVATGALMSLTSSQQGETIPAIAHAVWVKSTGKKEKTQKA